MTDQGQQNLDLLDADVRGHMERAWPQIVAWVDRLALGYRPEAGSELALDDQQVPSMSVSHLAWTSLGTGSQHLMSTVRYLFQFGPTVYSMHSMLRTAIWGAAQAVWLLAPENRDERVERAMLVSFYSQDNYRKWLNTFDEANPATKDVDQLRRAKVKTLEILDRIGPQAKLDQTEIVKRVAALVFSGQPDAVVECEQSWRSLGAIAHGLPWELDTRASSEQLTAPQGLAARRVTARWAELAGELSYASGFLQRGWALLDARGQTAPISSH